MKKQLLVAFGLAVVAAPAFATKARLEALGEDNFGSYYINDNRNIFLNPARINDNKDFVTYEFGKSSDDVAAVDSAANPRAGGGFVKSHGNMAYGLHFGDSSPSTGGIRQIGGNIQEVQPWDLFIGGDAGIKWGASFTYEQFDGQANSKRVASNGMRVRGGIVMGDLDVFAHISLANSAKDFVGNSVKGDIGNFIGAGYMLNNYKLFADVRMVGGKYQNTAAASTTKETIETNITRLGVARQERLNDRATLFAKLMGVRDYVKDNGRAYFGGQAGKVTEYVVPVVVGLEYAATSWLDLRASVTQNVYSQSEEKLRGDSKTSSHISNTAVAAGASLKFGEFAVDGLISTSDDGTAAGSASTNDGNGTLRTDSLMTRVSMIYRF